MRLSISRNTYPTYLPRRSDAARAPIGPRLPLRLELDCELDHSVHLNYVSMCKKFVETDVRLCRMRGNAEMPSRYMAAANDQCVKPMRYVVTGQPDLLRPRAPAKICANAAGVRCKPTSRSRRLSDSATIGAATTRHLRARRRVASHQRSERFCSSTRSAQHGGVCKACWRDCRDEIESEPALGAIEIRPSNQRLFRCSSRDPVQTSLKTFWGAHELTMLALVVNRPAGSGTSDR